MNHNDKAIIAYYDPEGVPHTILFNFENLKPGSAMRAAKCNQYDRILEALEGQGCDIHVWTPEYWPRYSAAFYAGNLLKK